MSRPCPNPNPNPNHTFSRWPAGWQTLLVLRTVDGGMRQRPALFNAFKLAGWRTLHVQAGLQQMLIAPQALCAKAMPSGQCFSKLAGKDKRKRKKKRSRIQNFENFENFQDLGFGKFVLQINGTRVYFYYAPRNKKDWFFLSSWIFFTKFEKEKGQSWCVRLLFEKRCLIP